jgi:hypothetical protein
MACKISPGKYEQKYLAYIISFGRSSCMLLGDFSRRISRELWWTNEEFFSVDIIPPWLSMSIYHLGDEQYTVDGSSSET